MDFDDIDSGTSNNDGGINPAWNEALEHIPEDARERVLPVFRKWDQNHQSGVQKVHSDYEPYKFLKDDGITADDVRMALGVVNAIQDNPEDVWKALGNSYGFAGADNQGQQNSGQGLSGQKEKEGSGTSEFVLPDEIRTQLDKLQSGQETMAQIILAKQQEEENARIDAALQKELKKLSDTHGSFDETFVLTMMQNGNSGDEAVKAYQEMAERILTENSRPKAPRLLSSGNGSGMPGADRIDVTKLSKGQTNDLVADYLARSRAANRD